MKTLASLLLILSIFFASCSKDDSPKNTGSADQVPNSSGDYWKYSVKSSTGESKGFLEVRIVKNGTLADGRPVTTWIYSFPTFTDTVYKIPSATSLEEYKVFPSTPGDSFPDMRYIFPLKTGMQWAINSTQATDSVKVSAESTITVPAGSFDQSMQLDLIGTHLIGNYQNNSKFWFTPHIGIIRMEYSILNLGPDQRNGIYELMEYRLK